MKSRLVLSWGYSVETDQLKKGWIAIHPPVGGGKGYVLTDIVSRRCIVRVPRKQDATKLRRVLEPLTKPEIRAILEAES